MGKRLRSVEKRELLERADPASSSRTGAEIVEIRKASATSRTEDNPSRQIDESILTVVGEGGWIQPPLDLYSLQNLSITNAIHAACLDVKASDSVGHGWQLDPVKVSSANSESDPDGDEDVERTKDMLELWLDQVFHDRSFQECIYEARYEAESIGWSLWEVVREGNDPKKKIVAVYPLPGAEARVVFFPEDVDDSTVRLKRTIYAQTIGSDVVFFVPFNSGLSIDDRTGRNTDDPAKRAHEVIVFSRLSNLNRYYSVPKWVAGMPSLAELNSIREYNMSFYESGGLLESLIHCSADSQQEAKTLQSEMMQKINEAAGGKRFIVVTWGSKNSAVVVNQLGKKAGESDRDFKTGREDLNKEVMIAHNVPPYRIGMAEFGSLGGSAATEMLKAYRYGAIEPWQIVFERILMRTLFSVNGLDLQKAGFTFAFKDVNWVQIESDIQKADAMTRAGVTTPNEARQILGLEQKKDARLDEHYFQGVRLGENAFGGAPPAGAVGDSAEGGDVSPIGESGGQESKPGAPGDADGELDVAASAPDYLVEIEKARGESIPPRMGSL